MAHLLGYTVHENNLQDHNKTINQLEKELKNYSIDDLEKIASISLYKLLSNTFFGLFKYDVLRAQAAHIILNRYNLEKFEKFI